MQFLILMSFCFPLNLCVATVINPEHFCSYIFAIIKMQKFKNLSEDTAVHFQISYSELFIWNRIDYAAYKPLGFGEEKVECF